METSSSPGQDPHADGLADMSTSSATMPATIKMTKIIACEIKVKTMPATIKMTTITAC